MHTCVDEALDEFPSDKLNRIWLTLHSVMNEILKHDGGNDYKIPHLNKEKMEREGTLPEALEVTDVAKQLLEVFEGY